MSLSCFLTRSTYSITSFSMGLPLASCMTSGCSAATSMKVAP